MTRHHIWNKVGFRIGFLKIIHRPIRTYTNKSASSSTVEFLPRLFQFIFSDLYFFPVTFSSMVILKWIFTVLFHLPFILLLYKAFSLNLDPSYPKNYSAETTSMAMKSTTKSQLAIRLLYAVCGRFIYTQVKNKSFTEETTSMAMKSTNNSRTVHRNWRKKTNKNKPKTFKVYETKIGNSNPLQLKNKAIKL